MWGREFYVFYWRQSSLNKDNIERALTSKTLCGKYGDGLFCSFWKRTNDNEYVPTTPSTPRIAL